MSTQSKTSGDVFTIALGRWFAELSDRGIFTTDESLVVRTWNPWLETNTGIPKDKAIGRSICELFPSVSARGLDQYFRDALGGEIRVLSESLHKFLIPIRREVSSIGLADMAQSARIAPLSLDGPIIGTITVIEDVTERVVSERELRHQIAVSEHARHVAEDASKLKDEFLATLSHEIRTPLNAVLGWARILRTQPNIGSRVRGLEVIERNAASQLRLVEDLLDMARVIGGKLRLDMKAVDLSEITQAAIDVVEPGAVAKKITISTRFPDTRSMVNGDADRLQQVVWNLMSNAVKFTEPGGRIEVAISRVGDSIELVVHDDGQGISRGFLPFVFDRFRQADGTPSRRHGGLGLGLALVRQIVELHGGKVSAESAGEERGSTFSIRIPATTRTRETVADGAREGGVSLNGVSVMVVDDDEDSREMLGVILRANGAVVRSIASTEEAWAALDGGVALPDILLSDVGMPNADGYDLIRRVRKSVVPALFHLPAIAVTGYANPDDRSRALAAGYHAHIPKPIEPTRLVTWIARLVAQASKHS